NLQPNDLVTRAEFVKILIKMLCIIPGAESYKPYALDTGYSDTPFDQFKLDPYYPYIKEGTSLGLIEGYKGETDPITKLFPFKPENTISRAEATKIILEALEFKGVVNLSNLKEGVPWYVNFMSAAQELTPYLKEGAKVQNNFIITPEEAFAPNKEMTFEELLVMVERVLSFYNCFEIDDDKDGMADFCEQKYGVAEPNEDKDADNVSNSEECAYGLNPSVSDSDGGGVGDGDEILLGTDPMLSGDDPKDEDDDGLTTLEETFIYFTDPFNPDSDDGGTNDFDEVNNCKNPLNSGDDEDDKTCEDSISGIYIVPSVCNTCPCESTFQNKADLTAGDIIFPVVSTYYEKYYDVTPSDKTYIFSKGNEVKIK
ncbi:MAG: S-layer homology domain-containing protein, partial [Patescibacteria group bacterium]